MKSLSAKLLVLTVLFVLIAEVLIYTPSIARFRITYLTERLGYGHLAGLTIEAAPDRMVTPELTQELLFHVDAHVVDLYVDGKNTHMLSGEYMPTADVSTDIDALSPFGMIMDAFGTMLQTDNRILQVTGTSPKDHHVRVVLVMNETPLRLAMYAYSERIMVLSIVISLFTAAAMFFTLRWFLIRPVESLTRSMTRFRRNPEGAELIGPLGRQDEIGTAMREFSYLQEALRSSLRQKTRLATLGSAVSRIAHDLRNMLATATIVSDRLSMSADPDVQRQVPLLFRAIDRAVAMCDKTLNFTREQPPPRTDTFALSPVIGEVLDDISAQGIGGVTLQNTVPEGVVLVADREHVFRLLHNLVRNAAEAGAAEVSISAVSAPDHVEITVSDNGPGIPDHVQEVLFQPFAPSARTGGSGLGLAIARDLVRAHGGSISLKKTGSEGTVFVIRLPFRSDATPYSGVS